jgi:hypothetical protein
MTSTASNKAKHEWHFKLVENPISIREAIWSPYKKFLRLVESQIEKFASAREKSVQDSAATAVEGAAAKTAAPE